MNNIMIPWFKSKKEEVFDKFGVELTSTFTEYISDKKSLNFKCSTCDFTFVSDLAYARSLFCKLCNPRSRQQTELTKFVQSLGFDVVLDTRKIIDPKEIDIWIPKLGIGVEYDGFYFHRNKDDSKKYAIAEENGIRIIRVFEDEYKYKPQIVLSRIRAVLGKVDNKVYARQCTVVELSNTESNLFFESTHIQGNVGATAKYGLMYNGEIVSAMSFGKPRYDKVSQWELLRFSNKLDTIVVGGASKLFSHFVKEHDPESIVSYCDVRYGSGNLYEVLGFKYNHTTQANYFYYKNGIRHSRVKFQKHKLPELLKYFDETLSESENMSYNGYIKIYDNGNKVYKWTT
jgi:very-short-patch-repair endonuclease